MNTSLIQKIVKRSNLTQLAWSLFGLVVVGGLFVFSLRYMYNFLFGPFNVQPDHVLQAGSASEPFQYWVNVEGEEMINTGVQYVSKSDSGRETVEASYYAMVLGDRLLLVRIDGSHNTETLPAKVTGWLSEVSSQENTKVVQDIETQVPSLKGRFLPYKLETGNFRLGGFMGIAVGLVILVASLWGLVTFFMRMADPNSHPIFKRLSRFGPLDFVTNGIDMELAAPHTTVGNLHLTNSWLVYATATNLAATRFEDIAWVYKYVLTRKSYGITVGKTFTAKVYDRFGVLCDIIAGRKEDTVNQMLVEICQRSPWAVMGYSAELEQAWKKDRQGFLAAVEKRKSS